MGSRKDKRTGARKRKWRKNRDDKKEASSASGSDSSSSGSSSSKEDDTSESPEKKKAKTDHKKSKKDDKTSKQLASWAAEKTSAQAPGSVNGEKIVMIRKKPAALLVRIPHHQARVARRKMIPASRQIFFETLAS